MKKLLPFILIGLVLVFTGFAAVRAVEPNVFNIQQATFTLGNALGDAGQKLGQGLGQAIASVTHFTDVAIDNDFAVTNNTTLSGTTTAPSLTFNASNAKALNFANNAASTTPGGMFSLQNTGIAKLCTTVELDITSASSLGGRLGTGASYIFGVGTSTAATSWAGGDPRELIASTTLPTSTTSLITNVKNPGSYVGTDQDIGGAPWVWDNGVYVNGVFSDASQSTSGNLDAYATSSAFTGMAGKVYINCHTR
jgi:hypothetical protein